jgi:hypothetical protein
MTAEYTIGPSRLGLVIKTESDFTERYIRGEYNGAVINEKREPGNYRLILEIGERNPESSPGPIENPDGTIGGIDYHFDGVRARFSSTALYGEIDFGARKGRVSITEVQSTHLGTLLRQVVFRSGTEEGLIMLHSISWVLNGCAYVSCGPPESGKSTIGRMLKDTLPVLSDEFNFVENLGRPLVWRSPVRTVEPIKDLDENYPVRAILFHRKSDRPYVRPMGPADGLRELEKNVFLGAFATADMKTDAFERVSEIAENAAVFEVGVTLEKRDILGNIDEIESSLEGTL